MDWHEQLIEELIYEQLKQRIDLLDLIDFERDLLAIVGPALETSGADVAPEEALAREEAVAHQLVERAWQRLEREWRRERSASAMMCPLCRPPFECPSGDELPARAGGPGE